MKRGRVDKKKDSKNINEQSYSVSQTPSTTINIFLGCNDCKDKKKSCENKTKNKAITSNESNNYNLSDILNEMKTN